MRETSAPAEEGEPLGVKIGSDTKLAVSQEVTVSVGTEHKRAQMT